ncbi:glycosyltransferase family 61 protein [bacterium]|nr:glycosyltransferase family 61 protein [bacterium]
MTMVLPFDLQTIPKEGEAETRAFHNGIEWGETLKDPILAEDFLLDKRFGTYVPHLGRADKFTADYDDLPVFVTQFNDGIVFGQEFLICDRQTPTLSHARLYLANLDNVVNRLDTLKEIEVTQGVTYLVGGNSPYRNFYHWCFQCLPGIKLLRNLARERNLDYKIVVPPLDPVRKRSLELLDIAPTEWLELQPDRYLSGVPLLYTNITSSDFSFQPSSRVIGLLDDYRDTCVEMSPADLPSRFYISRRDAPGRRPLDNEESMIAALAARGYKEIVLSDLALEDQVNLFHGAEIIVSPHGAGLVNLMFAPKTARLVEITPENYRHACFFRIAQVRGLGYSQVLAKVLSENPNNKSHGSHLEVDIDEVLRAVDREERVLSKLTDNRKFG